MRRFSFRSGSKPNAIIAQSAHVPTLAGTFLSTGSAICATALPSPSHSLIGTIPALISAGCPLISEYTCDFCEAWCPNFPGTPAHIHALLSVFLRSPPSGGVCSLPLWGLLTLSPLGRSISRPLRSFLGVAAVVFLQLASGAVTWVVRLQHPSVIVLLSALVPLRRPRIGRVSGFFSAAT
jgi:hypothetical protein